MGDYTKQSFGIFYDRFKAEEKNAFQSDAYKNCFIAKEQAARFNRLYAEELIRCFMKTTTRSLLVCLFAIFYLCSCEYWKNQQGKTQKEIYPNGQVKAIYTVSADGLRTGVAKTYYPNGVIQSEETYKNGTLEGEQRTYYENGRLENEYVLKNGKVQGIARYYYENGSLQLDGNFKEGKKNGMARAYYESGMLETMANFKDEYWTAWSKSITSQENWRRNVTIKMGKERAYGKHTTKMGIYIGTVIIKMKRSMVLVMYITRAAN